jgi:hypothetical protein
MAFSQSSSLSRERVIEPSADLIATDHRSTTMQYAKALKMTIARGFLGAALVLLTFALFMSATPNAQATPALAKGKPCNTCHSSLRPSKYELKE